jgi:predicted RNA-binding Zn ribbon-like protein
LTDAALVVALANARALRRPIGSRATVHHDALADASDASALLAPFLGRDVTARELPRLRELQHAVTAIADAIIGASPPPAQALNALLAREPVVCVLESTPDEPLRMALKPRRPSAAGTLTLEVIRQLDGLDPSRLRRCARPECQLVFYDTTRSGTQRWHAERPCGLRERQRRHRERARDDGHP